MNNANKNLKIFFGSLAGLMLLNILLVLWADPYRVWNQPWVLKTETHMNFYLRKLEMMPEDSAVEAIILGSSTSENFVTKDVKTILGKKAFHLSVAGSQTIGRMALIRAALDKFPNLDTVIYVADFYEFNDQFEDYLAPEVIDNHQLSVLTPEVSKDWKHPSKVRRFWQIYSHVVLEKSFNQIGKRITGKQKFIYDAAGDVLVNEKATGTYLNSQQRKQLVEAAARDIDKPVSSWLANEIQKSIQEYTQGALKAFAYSVRTESMYRELLDQLKKRNAQLILIASPIHPEFEKAIFQDNTQLAMSYGRWMSFVEKLGESDNVESWVSTDEQQFPIQKPFWRDGVHYSHEASAAILSSIADRK